MRSNRPNPYRPNPYKQNPYKQNPYNRPNPYGNNYGMYNRRGNQGLSTGNWITIVSGVLFIFSLFLDWVSTFGYGFSGISFMKFDTDILSGQPILFPLTLIAAIVCVLLSTHLFTAQGPSRVIPALRIIFGILGVIPFILFAVQLSKNNDFSGFLIQYEIITFAFGGWLAVLGAAGLLLGAIMTVNED